MKNSTVKQLLESDHLLVGISELSKVTNVSPRQIRYWEQKGYIESTGEKSGNRKFKLPMVVKVESIKHFLDEGFTLTAAVEKAREQLENIHQTKILSRKIFKGSQQIDDRYVLVHLDGFTNRAGLYLIRDKETEQVTYQTIENGTDVTAVMIEKWFEFLEK